MYMYYYDYFCWIVNKIYFVFVLGVRIFGVFINVYKNIINILFYFIEI